MLLASTDAYPHCLHPSRPGGVVFVFGSGGDPADGVSRFDREGETEWDEVGSNKKR